MDFAHGAVASAASRLSAAASFWGHKLRTSIGGESGRFGAVLAGLAGAVAGAAAGLALGAAGVWIVRTVGSDSSSWTDLGVAAVAVVVAAPLLSVVGALVALRLRTGRAVARPIPMTAAVVVALAVGGALIGSGVGRFSLAVVGAAVGLAVASALDRERARR
jgi:hypothetical protein